MTRGRTPCSVMVTLSVCLFVGCRSSDVLSDNGVLSVRDKRCVVDGPFHYRKALSSTRIVVFGPGGTQTVVRLRGVLCTGDSVIDGRSQMELDRWLRGDDVYLLRDGKRDDVDEVSGIVLRPTTQFGTIDTQTGNVTKRVENFAIVQLRGLRCGEVVLDKEDKGYWLHTNFLMAESEAKRNRKGIWVVGTVAPQRQKP